MPVRPPTAIGFVLQALEPHVSGPVLLPFPSSPELFRPQSTSVPFERSATLWLSTSAAEIATTRETPLTGIGFLLHPRVPQLSGPVLFPFPSSPFSLSPHAMTVPFERRARL